jgi:putative membrane protein
MLDKKQMTQLKKKQIFDNQPQEVIQSRKPSDGQEGAGIHARQEFTHGAFISETSDQEVQSLNDGVAALKADPIHAINPKKSKGWRLSTKLLLLAFLSLGLVQTGLSLVSAFEQSPWLFGFYALILSIVLSCAGMGLLSELKKLRKLTRVQQEQATGERLAQSMQMGEADKFIAPLLAQYPASPATRGYLASISPEHNDAEKVLLFDNLVLSEQDSVAKKLVTRFAAESALLLAASPLAALDMAIILWRNQKMINQIALVYGIELGYWSRVKLLKSIVVNIIYAGSSEVIADLGTQLLSVEMAGKLSARIAQGLGGGLLTARLGYQAMALCRPLAFSAANKPKLSKIHQHLLSELKNFSMANVMGSESTGSKHKDNVTSDK